MGCCVLSDHVPQAVPSPREQKCTAIVPAELGVQCLTKQNALPPQAVWCRCVSIVFNYKQSAVLLYTLLVFD